MCFKKDDHNDNKHPNWTWLHICSHCMDTRNDKVRHPEVDCPFKTRWFKKWGGPFKGPINEYRMSASSDQVVTNFKLDNLRVDVEVGNEVPSHLVSLHKVDLDEESSSNSVNPDITVIDTNSEIDTLKGAVKGRPWSVKAAMFENSQVINNSVVIEKLGFDKSELTSDSSGRLVDCLDQAWKKIDTLSKLPQGFLQRHNSIDLVERCDERLLPLWPVCPGPFSKASDKILTRPKMGKELIDRDLFAAWVYDKVSTIGVPNYRGARVQINTKLNFGVMVRNFRRVSRQTSDRFVKIGTASRL